MITRPQSSAIKVAALKRAEWDIVVCGGFVDVTCRHRILGMPTMPPYTATKLIILLQVSHFKKSEDFFSIYASSHHCFLRPRPIFCTP